MGQRPTTYCLAHLDNPSAESPVDGISVDADVK